MRCIKLPAALLALCCLSLACLSAGATQVLVGQVAPLTGPESSQGRAYAAGMQLYFNSVNKAGGVNGHTFALVSKDDMGRPEETVAATKQMLATEQPMVLAGYLGQRNVTALLDAGFLERERITLVGYRSADVRPAPPQLYNVRASLLDELTKITEHVGTIGVTRLGLLYEEGPAAAGIVSATEELAAKRNAKVVSKAGYEAGSTRVSAAIDLFIKTPPQAIILVSTGTVAARFIEQYRAAGGAAQIFVHSGADMERVARQIGEDRLSFVTTVMKGVAIVQVVPSPYQVSRIGKELNDAVAKAGKLDVPVSYVMLEGFIAGKVIVEAVRRQGARPSREGMAPALDAIDNLNLGGYAVGYKTAGRSGSRFVELTIISDTGRTRQ